MKDRWTVKRTTRTVGPLLIVTVPCPGGVWMRIRGGVSGAYYGPWRLALSRSMAQVGWAMPDDLSNPPAFLHSFPVITMHAAMSEDDERDFTEPVFRLTPEETDHG